MAIRADDICCRDFDILGRYITRLRRPVIESVLKDYDIAFGLHDLPLSESKYNQKRPFVDVVLATQFKQGLTYNQLAEFDLRHVQSRTAGKKWTAHQLVGGSDGPAASTLPARDIEAVLNAQLNKYYKQHTVVKPLGDCMWFRLSIWDGVHEPQLPSTTAIVYFVWYPASKYILMSNIKKEHQNVVLEALGQALRCHRIRACDMTGRRLDALTELLLHSASQGIVKSMRLQKVDSNPLSRRVRPLEPDLDDDGDHILQAEDAHVIKKRKTTAKLTFGQGVSAALEEVTYHLEGKYKGTSKVPLRRSDVPCKVRLQGSNVIEGVREMLQARLTTDPLPAYLGQLHSQASNSFNVRDITHFQSTSGATQR